MADDQQLSGLGSTLTGTVVAAAVAGGVYLALTAGDVGSSVLRISVAVLVGVVVARAIEYYR